MPFNIEIVFTNAVGLAIYSPDKTLTESKGIYTFPLIVKEVLLYSSSPSLADNYREINNILKSKYKKFDTAIDMDTREEVERHMFFDSDRDTGGEVYYKGITLNVTARESEYRIYYGTDAVGGEFAEKLAEIYRKHLATLESHKTKGKKDSSSGL